MMAHGPTLPDWCFENRRATEKQKGYLKKLGLPFDEQFLTKKQASHMIQGELRHLKARAELNAGQGREHEPENDGEMWARRHEEGWGPGGY
jgi:hypothetical protein